MAKAWLDCLLRAGTANHLDVGRFQMSVFMVGFLHTRIMRGILGVFLKVVHPRIGDNAGDRHRVSNVLRERCGVTLHIPAAAVIGFEQILILMRGLLQASGDRASVTLVLVAGKCPSRHEAGEQQTKSELLHRLFPPGSAFPKFDVRLDRGGCAYWVPR